MAERRTVLITGAAGNLGTKVRRHLEAQGGYALRLLDRDSRGDPDIEAVDLAAYDESWARRFAGVDAVLHFAAHPSPGIDWATAQRLNIDLTFNVYDAAAARGAGRVVFASSNWVMAGYRFGDERLTPDLPPRPVNPYGVSKLVGERAGRSLERRGVSFIGFRIGYCQPGENRPGPQMGYGLWGRQMWLSNRDLCQAMEKAILAEGIGFAVLNLMSDNPGMRWDLEPTRRAIGYAPQDGHRAEVGEAERAAADAVRDRYALPDFDGRYERDMR